MAPDEVVTITVVLLIIIAVLLFGFIIFIHEFGHFIMAKLSKIRVNEFAIGMGPTIVKFQKGETKYALRLFPIGGYCAMEGEDEESDDEAAFGNKPVWKRILVVVMGAVMNIILGIALMMILLGQQNGFASTTIADFADNASSQATGLQVGDQITSINGYAIWSSPDMSFALATDKDAVVDMDVIRNGQKITLNDVTFDTVENENGTHSTVIDFIVVGIPKTFGSLITESFNQTVSMVRMVWASLAGLITGQFGFGDLSGPVGVATAITQVASEGLKTNFLAAVNNIIYIMVVITVNLGVVNLLPLPALDGGRLVFLIIEGIRRKPVPAKYEGWIHAAGFVLLILLMVVVTFSDVMRLITGHGLGA